MSVLIQFSCNNILLPNKFTIIDPSKSKLIALLKTLKNEELLKIDFDLIDLYHNSAIITDTSNNFYENTIEKVCLIEIRENTQISGSKSQLSGHKGPILCINALKNKDKQNITILSGGADKTVRIWKDGFMKYTYNNHKNWVQVLKSRFINEKQIEIVSGSIDGEVIYYLIDFVTGENIDTKIIGKFKDGISNIEFYKDFLFASSRDKTIKVFNSGCKIIGSYQHLSAIKGFLIHNKYIYSFCDKSIINIYKIIDEPFSLKYIKQIKVNGVVTKMNYKDNLITAGTKTGKIYFIEDLKIKFSLSPHSDIISGISFFKDYLVTTSFDKKLLFHTINGKLIKEYITNLPIYTMDISKNFVTVGGSNGIISLYNENKMIQTFKCSEDVYDLKCVENKIIAASRDSNLYIFQ